MAKRPYTQGYDPYGNPYARTRGGLIPGSMGLLGLGYLYQPDLDETGKAFKEQYGDRYSWLNDMSDKEVGALLDQYFIDSDDNGLGQALLGDYDVLDIDSVLQDLDQVNSYNFDNLPTLPDAQEAYQNALGTISAENAEIESLYDQLLDQQTTGYQQQLQDINKSYGDYRQQVLGNQYAQNAQMSGTAQSEMSRSRQRALESGASAGLRLANNVNTLLSMQNQQASQSLQTSNNLAQMLLNQQQAAAGVRGDYQNALASDTSRRAELRRGTAERANAYGNSMLRTNQSIYDQQMEQWENDFDTNLGNNPFADAYRQQLRKQSTQSRVGQSQRNSLGY